MVNTSVQAHKMFNGKDLVFYINYEVNKIGTDQCILSVEGGSVDISKENIN